MFLPLIFELLFRKTKNDWGNLFGGGFSGRLGGGFGGLGSW